MSTNNYYIGIDVGGTNIKSGVVSPVGEIVFEKKIDTQAEGGVRHVLERIAGLVKDFNGSVGGNGNIAGVGVGAPGQIDYDTGVVRNAPNLPGWKDVQAQRILENLLKVTVAWDNDANVAALGESVYGSGKGASEMMMITLGTGIGSGFILRGEVYRGCKGYGGEFGHTILDPEGPPCHCGRRGCVEAYAGSYGILRRLKEKLGSGFESVLSNKDLDKMTTKDLTEAADQGDALAIEVYRETGYYLGLGLANMVTLLNLERIVVGGGVAKAGELILKSLRESMKRFCMTNAFGAVQVVPAVLGNRAGVIGAAHLAKLKSNI